MHKNILKHLQSYIFRGFLAVIPIVVTIVTVRFLYVLIDQRLMSGVHRALGYRIPGLGILLLIICLYLLGIIASNVLGKQIFHLLEKISHRIPLVKTTYQVGKQLASTFIIPEKQAFQRAVLVRFPTHEAWAVAFVTGTIKNSAKGEEDLLKVLVPSAPNPMSGIILFVKPSDVRDPGWTVEEAMKFVISDGIISKETL